MLEVKTNTIQLRMDDNNLSFRSGKGIPNGTGQVSTVRKWNAKKEPFILTKHWKSITNWYRTESERESVVHLPD